VSVDEVLRRKPGGGGEPPPHTPTILTRTISAPPGAPWDQSRAALLEARLGAPLPIAELKFKLKRLESWRPNRAGKFAAFYMRSAEYRGPFETVVGVEGASITVEFGRTSRQLERARTVGTAAVMAAVILALVIAAVTGAVSARRDAAALVDRGEAMAAARGRALTAFNRREAQIAEAKALQKGRVRVSELVSDLEWASANRASDARIVAVHLYQGLFAVEARGSNSPMTSQARPLTRPDRPVRDDVWLWALAPAGGAGAADVAHAR